MHADYPLCRSIMRICHDVHPTGLHFSARCWEFPDNLTRDVRH